MSVFEVNDQLMVISTGFKINLIDLGSSSNNEETVIQLPDFVDDKSKKSEPVDVGIVIGSLSPLGNSLAVIDSFKRLFLISVTDRNIVTEFKVERRPTQVICEENFVLVSDGAGDVYHFDSKTKVSKLIMGHLSMILDMKLCPNKRFIATSDRDEKIRISNFPNTYNINSFCLSHSEFVSCIAFVNENLLLSGSGDGTVKLWSFLDGKLLYDLDCKKALDILKLDQDIAIKNILQLNQSTFSISFYSSNCLLIVSIIGESINIEKLLNFTGSTCYKQFRFRNSLVIVSDSMEKIITSYNFESGFSENCDHFLSEQKVRILTHSLKGLNTAEEDLKMFYKQWFNNVEGYLRKKEERIKGTD